MSLLTYETPWLADFFHSFPHINLTFQFTNTTFDPDDSSYRESILFLALIPAVWCLLALLFTSCCLCLQCNKKKPKQRSKAPCIRATAAFLIIFAIGGAAVGFYGNEEADKGVDSFVDAVQETNKTVEAALQTLNELDRLAKDVSDNGLVTLNAVVLKYLHNDTITKAITKLIGQIKAESDNVRHDISNIKVRTGQFNLDDIAKDAVTVEFYRWIGTIVLFCWHLVLLMFFIFGVMKKARCWLVAVSLGYLSLLLIWGSAGVYLGGTVAAGDLCVDPNPFVIKEASNRLEKGILESYIECKHPDDPRDFSRSLDEAMNSVLLANSTLEKANRLAQPFPNYKRLAGPIQIIRNDLKHAMTKITSLKLAISCKGIHDNYVQAVNGLCVRALTGVSLILLVIPVIGMCLIFLQFMAPRAWLLLSKRKYYNNQVDDTDPFLPHPPPYMYNDYGTIPTGSPDNVTGLGDRSRSSGYMRGSVHGSVDETALMTPLSESPPPAYHPGAFAEEYNNLGPRRYNYSEDA